MFQNPKNRQQCSDLLNRNLLALGERLVRKFLICFLITGFIIKADRIAAQTEVAPVPDITGEELPGLSGDSVKPSRSPFLNILADFQVGYLAGLTVGSVSSADTNITGTDPGLGLYGYDILYSLRDLKVFDRSVYVYHNMVGISSQFTFKSQVGEHSICGHDQYYGIGGRIDLLERPVAVTKKIAAVPYFKLGGFYKMNLFGSVTYPGGPREFEIASLTDTVGVNFGLGFDLGFEFVTVAPEFAWNLHLTPYQDERWYTFNERRDEFNVRVKNSIEDVQSSELSLNTFTVSIAIRYAFSHLKNHLQ